MLLFIGGTFLNVVFCRVYNHVMYDILVALINVGLIYVTIDCPQVYECCSVDQVSSHRD